MDPISIFVLLSLIKFLQRGIKSAADETASTHFDFNAAVKVEEIVNCVVIVANCGDRP